MSRPGISQTLTSVSTTIQQARRKQLQIGGHRYENFRAQIRNLLRLRYEKDGGKDMEIIWRTHVETMRVGGGGGTDVKMIEGG